MCGIGAKIVCRRSDINVNTFSQFSQDFDGTILKNVDVEETLLNEVKKRGPTFPNGECRVDEIDTTIYGAVLSLRGQPTPQPVVSQNGSILCWNGEIFGQKFLEENYEKSDTQYMMENLAKASNHQQRLEFLDGVEGPFSLLYFDPNTKSIFFSRDKLGRRSLTLTITDHPTNQDLVVIYLASSSFVPTDGSRPSFEIIPSGPIIFELNSEHNLTVKIMTWPTLPAFNSDSFLSPPENRTSSPSPVDYARLVYPYLKRAVAARLFTTRPPADPQRDATAAILFSGGLDSTIIAGITCELLANPPEEYRAFFTNYNGSKPIVDLLSVAFSPTAPDRLTGLLSMAELRGQWNQKVSLRFVCLSAVKGNRNLIKEESKEVGEVLDVDRLKCLLGVSSSLMDASIGSVLFVAGSGRGKVLKDSFWTSECGRKMQDDPQSFLDAIPDVSIDTAEGGRLQRESQQQGRENEGAVQQSNAGICSIETCPLKTANGCVHGACKLCCVKLRKFAHAVNSSSVEGGKSTIQEFWTSLFPPRSKTPSPSIPSLKAIHSFCPIHTTPEERQEAKRLRHQAADCANELLASHLDHLEEYSDGKLYETASKILLTGQGADELFGGYGRHRESMRVGGVSALRNEIRLDLSRLWLRNLGRDDRLLSCHGREARQPFLDQALCVCVASFEGKVLVGEGGRAGEDKIILRALASDVLKLNVAAGFSKRAMQFGSRSSKMFEEENQAEGAKVKKGKGKSQAIF